MPFITFEGADGSGKTTHIQQLATFFGQQGRPVLVTREPGGTKLGNEIRAMVLGDNERNVSPMAEMLLIAAARAQHVSEVLQPGLAEGKLILCDRYIDSSLVYQGVALGVGLDLVANINNMVVDGLWPDLTILLDVPPEVAYERSILMRRQADRIESRGLAYYRQVCAGYRLIAQKWPERIKVVDANRPVATVHRDIRRVVSSIL
jgi:dTMP kinase